MSSNSPVSENLPVKRGGAARMSGSRILWTNSAPCAGTMEWLQTGRHFDTKRRGGIRRHME